MSETILQTVAVRPLCVDLDGTLIAGDMLMETIVYLLRHRPLELLLAPLWLAQHGRAGLKSRVAARGSIDPTALPYRLEVVEFLRAERAAGRPIYLATAADAAVAHPIAEHLGLFDRVLCSDGVVNLKGENKLAAIVPLCPEGFDYVGDSRADLPLWKAAKQAYVVGPDAALLRDARSICASIKIFDGGAAHRWGAVMKTLRPHQWSKNLLLLLPVFLAHDWHEFGKLCAVMLALVSFSLCASAVYVCNDLLDVHDDRHHPRKHKRPFASGTLPLTWAPGLLAALLAVSFGLAGLFLPGLFVMALGGYFLMSASYSMYFKRKLLVDVMMLAGLYTLRLLAGGAACGVPVSPWLLAFSMFLFVSLAFAKRYAELLNLTRRIESAQDSSSSAVRHLRGRGYMTEDLEIIQAVGPCSGYLAVLVFALYIYSSEIIVKLYKHPLALWLLCPLLMYWITRIWFIARRGWLQEDPVLFAMKDRISWFSASIAVMLVYFATVNW